jgi:hypothetical protein
MCSKRDCQVQELQVASSWFMPSAQSVRILLFPRRPFHKYIRVSEISCSKSVQGFGGKARRKETTGKTKAYVGRWYQNGS